MINIRFANIDDIKKVFDLSNDDLVRKNSIHKEKLEWESHIEWFYKRIVKQDEPFYIVEDENKNFIGQVRIDKSNNEYIISVSILPEFRGQGFAPTIIKEAVKKSKLKNITAYIYRDNVSSIKSFEKAGFKNSGFQKIEYYTNS